MGGSTSGLCSYLIVTNFREHLISRKLEEKISRFDRKIVLKETLFNFILMFQKADIRSVNLICYNRIKHNNDKTKLTTCSFATEESMKTKRTDS